MLARIYLASASLLLFAAPIRGSAGLRGACILVCALALAILLARGKTPLPPSPPRVLLIALVSWALLAVFSLAWSIDPRLTLEALRSELLYGAAVFAIFYVGAGDRSRWQPWWLALLGGTLFLTVAEALREQFGFDNREWHGGVGAFSTHIALVAPLLLALRWFPPWGLRARNGIFALALGALFAAAWLTQNRVVWAAILVSFVIAAWARRASGLPLPDWNLRHRVAVGAIAVVILALFAGVSAERSRVHVPLEPTLTASLHADLRPKLWTAGLALVREAPLLGHGFGRAIAEPVFAPLTPPPFDPRITHAHNLFLDMAIQLGVLGLAAFLVSLVLLAAAFRSALRDRATAPAGILGLAVLAAFVAKNLTDDFLHRQNALVFWALMGLLLGLSRSRTSAPQPSGAGEPATAAPAPSA